MKFFLIISSLIILISCSKKTNDITSAPVQEESGTWNKVDFIKEDFRVSSQVKVVNNTPLLMPGKGPSRYGLEPEIYSFKGGSWHFETEFKDHSTAGNAQYWVLKNQVFILGGNNSAFAPTDRIILYDIPTNSFTFHSKLPTKYQAMYGSCNNNEQGFLCAMDKILSYNFSTSTWDSIPFPNALRSTSAKVELIDNILHLILPDLEQDNFYQLNADNTWTSLPSFTGGKRFGQITDAYDNFLVVGFGMPSREIGTTLYHDLWVYNAQNSTWKQAPEYTGTPFHSGLSFFYKNYLYLGGGAQEVLLSSEVINTEMFRINIKNLAIE